MPIQASSARDTLDPGHASDLHKPIVGDGGPSGVAQGRRAFPIAREGGQVEESGRQIEPTSSGGSGQSSDVRLEELVRNATSYEKVTHALSEILAMEDDLARSALAEDRSVALRMVSREDAAGLSQDGVLFLSGYSIEFEGVGYFPADAYQAEKLADLQSAALELFWSDVNVDEVRTRMLSHFAEVVGESAVSIRPRPDGMGLEVVDASGKVRGSHLFKVPGYVL